MTVSHSELDRIVLRHAGMSEESELTPDERKNMKAARAAHQLNPLMPAHRLYRIIRPRPEADEI